MWHLWHAWYPLRWTIAHTLMPQLLLDQQPLQVKMMTQQLGVNITKVTGGNRKHGYCTEHPSWFIPNVLSKLLYISVLCWQNMAMSHSCPKWIAVYNSSQDAVACASWDLSLLVVDHPSFPATATTPWIVTKLWTHHVHPACMGASASAASPWEGFEVSVLWEALIFSWMAACQGRKKRLKTSRWIPRNLDPWTPKNKTSVQYSKSLSRLSNFLKDILLILKTLVG